MKKLENKTPKWFWFFNIPFMILATSGLLQINSIFGDEMPEYKKYYHKLLAYFNRFFDSRLTMSCQYCLTINTVK